MSSQDGFDYCGHKFNQQGKLWLPAAKQDPFSGDNDFEKYTQHIFGLYKKYVPKTIESIKQKLANYTPPPFAVSFFKSVQYAPGKPVYLYDADTHSTADDDPPANWTATPATMSRLQLAGACFERSIDALGQYHRLGPWMNRKETV